MLNEPGRAPAATFTYLFIPPPQAEFCLELIQDRDA